MEKACIVCNNKFKTTSNRSQYCSKECRSHFYFLKNQERLKQGIEGIDYVIDNWNGFVTPRIYGKWMKAMHPGKTTQDYLNDFPNAILTCEKDKFATSKNSGLHMKDPKYKKMASEAIKGKQNPNHKSKVSEDVRKSRSPFSKKFNRYKSSEDRDKFLKSINWDLRITNTQLEWWLNKGYSLEESKERLKERQSTFTLEKCIYKHGEKDGTKIFNERQTKRKKSLQENFKREGDGRSPSSKFANTIIKELCNHLGIEIPSKEKWIKDKKTGNAYSYDFTYGKKIIEFNGDYWHCNPYIYKKEYLNKNKGLTANEIWNYDLEKLKTAKKYSYQVLVIWESEWRENPDETLKKCIQFLHD